MENKNTKTQNKLEKLLRALQWLPVYVTLLVLPFVVYYKAYESRLYGTPYYPDDIYNYDFNLYYKQFIFFFITGALVLLFGFLCYKNRYELKTNLRTQCGILIPLAIYLIFAFLSSVCSDYRYGAFTGSDGLFQGFWTLFGYVMLAVYLFFLIKTEKDVSIASIALTIGASLQALLGVLQYAGMNLYDFNWYQKLITPDGYLEAVGPVTNQMETMVSLCANNPNYAGVLLAILASFCLGMLLTERKKLLFFGELVLFAALLISLIGTDSAAGLLVFSVVAILALIFRFIGSKKNILLMLGTIVFLSVGIVIVSSFARLPVLDNLKSGLTVEKKEPNPLSRMVTTKSGIEITYLEVPFTVYVQNDGESFYFAVKDETGEEMILSLSEDERYYYVEHPVLGGGALKIQAGVYEGMPLLVLHMNGQQWNFVSLGENYYFLNPYLHLETLEETERISFSGYENLATNRGLIWSQTLPLLKDTLFLGVGANNFVHLYPQNNYKDIYYYYGSMQVITKPHNMYLQTATETGVISLLALLAFWVYYLVQSARLYLHCSFDCLSKRLGFCCALVVLVYLGCGLTNDSMISVAPVFWCIQGVGLAMNRKNMKNT